VLNAQGSGEENVCFASLDFLNGADVEVHKLGEPFLRDVLSNTLAPKIRAECRKLFVDVGM